MTDRVTVVLGDTVRVVTQNAIGPQGPAGAVESVNARMGAVVGLAEDADLTAEATARVVGDTTRTVRTVTDSTTLVLADAGDVVEVNKATAATVTIPLNSSVAFPTGTFVDVSQIGAGAVTVAGAGGVTVSGASLVTNGIGSVLRLRKRATDTWVVEPSLSGAIGTVEDEGAVVVAGATRLNFTGLGVSVADAGSGEATVTIPGGSSSLVVVKSADESVSASTTLQDDNELTFDISANATCPFDVILFVESSSTVPDFKVALTIPSGATLRAHAFGMAAAASSFASTLQANSFLASSGDSTDVALGTWATTVPVRITGTVINGATAGAVTLQWAQFTSDAAAVTVKRGSCIVVYASAEAAGVSGPVVAHGNSGATETFAAADGDIHTVTLDANCTATLTTPSADADDMLLVITQDATGGRTMTWPASVKWPSGTAPVLSVGAGKIDTVSLVTYNGGTSWLGYFNTDFR